MATVASVTWLPQERQRLCLARAPCSPVILCASYLSMERDRLLVSATDTCRTSLLPPPPAAAPPPPAPPPLLLLLRLLLLLLLLPPSPSLLLALTVQLLLLLLLGELPVLPPGEPPAPPPPPPAPPHPRAADPESKLLCPRRYLARVWQCRHFPAGGTGVSVGGGREGMSGRGGWK